MALWLWKAHVCSDFHSTLSFCGLLCSLRSVLHFVCLTTCLTAFTPTSSWKRCRIACLSIGQLVKSSELFASLYELTCPAKVCGLRVWVVFFSIEIFFPLLSSMTFPPWYLTFAWPCLDCVNCPCLFFLNMLNYPSLFSWACALTLSGYLNSNSNYQNRSFLL